MVTICFRQKKILFKILVFSLTYTICLILWIQLKPYYGNIMTRFGSECAAQFSNFRIINFQHDHETAQISYSRVIYSKKGIGDLVIDLKIDVSNYSFNIPLTIALVAVLLPMVKWNPRTMCGNIDSAFVYSFLLCILLYQPSAILLLPFQ